MVGNSGALEHLIVPRKGIGQSNRSQINFETRLRCYKSKTNYRPSTSWVYPATRSFAPAHQLKEKTDAVKLHNEDFKEKFKDKYPEKNFNCLREQAEKQPGNAYDVIKWQSGLRT